MLQELLTVARFFYLSFVVLREHKKQKFDVIFVDQISATISLLKCSGIPVLIPLLLVANPNRSCTTVTSLTSSLQSKEASSKKCTEYHLTFLKSTPLERPTLYW